jgi:3-hydroxyisobutyrate dehydrogenase-like beta-hydroxyacid dehydrogenase
MSVTNDRGEVTPTAVLGTGIMGSAMARNLLRAGLPTPVWDRSAWVEQQPRAVTAGSIARAYATRAGIAFTAS